MKQIKKKMVMGLMLFVFICGTFGIVSMPVYAESNEAICKRVYPDSKSDQKACLNDLNTQDKANKEAGKTDVSMCGSNIKLDSRIPKFVSNIYQLLKIATPIILVIFGMLDFAKATAASDPGEMKKAGNKFIKRLIAGMAVFFVMSIVQFTIDLLKKAGAGSAIDCASCLLNNNCKK